MRRGCLRVLGSLGPPPPTWLAALLDRQELHLGNTPQSERPGIPLPALKSLHAFACRCRFQEGVRGRYALDSRARRPIREFPWRSIPPPIQPDGLRRAFVQIPAVYDRLQYRTYPFSVLDYAFFRRRYVWPYLG